MKKYLLIFLCGLIVFGMSSCLKDKGFEDHEYGHNLDDVPKVIELGVLNNLSHYQSVALDFKDSSVYVNIITVRLAATEPAQQDIKVTIDTSFTNAQLTAYDAANNQTTVRLPSTIFSFPDGLTVTIKKGERQAYLRMLTNTSKFDPSTSYGLGFKIKSIEPSGYVASQNFGEYVTTIGAKNKYDGRYKLTGYHNRDPYTFPYDTEMYMVTVGGASVRFYWPDVSSFGHPIGVGPGNDLSWYGAAIGPVVVFDPATDLVTDVFNAGGATVITKFTGAGAGVSRYDAATKTIYVSWNYSNNPLRAFFDKLEYLGPRP